MPSTFNGTLYIHIGPHKTGTTTIQAYLHENAQFLIANNVLYPQVGRGVQAPQQHWQFGQAVLDGDTAYLGKFAQSVDQELAKCGAETLLISTEVLSRQTVTAEQLSRVAELFPNARRIWVMMLRRQDRLIGSFYSEHVKKGLLAYPAGMEKVSGPELLDHLRRIRLVADASDGDPIIIGSFEQMKTDLVRMFLDMIGLNRCYSSERVNPSPQNVAMPPFILRGIRLINALPKSIANPLRERLVSFFIARPEMFPVGSKKSPDTGHFTRHYNASNSAITQLFFDGQNIGLACENDEVSATELIATHSHLQPRVEGWLPTKSMQVDDVEEGK